MNSPQALPPIPAPVPSLWERLRPRLFLLAGIAALMLGIWGQQKVASNHVLALRLFALGGLLMVFLAPKQGPTGAYGEIPDKPQPLQAWEPWFVLALVIFGGWFRLLDLTNSPPGGHGHEGEMVGHILAIGRTHYTAHAFEGDVLWPSLIFYQGLGFSDWFGYSQASFRLAGVVWGILSLPCFYFLVRLVAVPWVAAAGALLFNANQLHLAISRNYFPGSILFVAPLAGFALLLIGLREKKWGYFAVAGFTAGLSMHGYVPGRAVGILFLLWFLWLYLFDQERFPGLKKTAVFFAGYLVCAGPVLWWAATHWDHFNAYVGGHSPYGGQGVKRHIQGFIAELPVYARWLHVRGDPSNAEDIAYHPALDLVSGALFPVAFFFCVFLCWRPVYAFALALLVTGMAPAVFGGGFAHPTGRRLVLALPSIFLIVSLGLERVRAQMAASGGLLGRVALPLAVLGAAVWANAHSWDWYFNRYSKDPGVITQRNPTTHHAGQEIRAHEGWTVANTPSVTGWVTTPLLLPEGVKTHNVQGVDELLALNPQSDVLFMAGEPMAWARPLFASLFPSFQYKSYPWPGADPDPAFQQLALIRCEIKKEDILGLRGLRLAPGGTPMAVFDSPFPKEYSSMILALEGTFFMPDKGGEFKAELAWPHWSLKVDGRPLPWGQARLLDGGVHRLRLEGKLPNPAPASPLPLRLFCPYGDLVAMRRVVSADFSFGATMEFGPGLLSKEPWTQAPSSRRIEPVMNTFYYDPTPLPVPYSVRAKAWLKVPETGPYAFGIGMNNEGRIKVKGLLAFDNVGRRHAPAGAPVTLKAGEEVSFEGEFSVCPSPECRIIKVMVKRPGNPISLVLPLTWIRPRA